MKQIKPSRATSLFAFAEILENLGERQLEVFKAIDKIETCCDFDIADGWKIGTGDLSGCDIQDHKRKG